MIKPKACKMAECALAHPSSRVRYEEKWDEYVIDLALDKNPIVTQQLLFCLWCGAKLPEGFRDQWFDELEALGVDPWGQSIPADYVSVRWIETKVQKKG